MAVQRDSVGQEPVRGNWQFFCDKDLDALFQKEATTADPEARKPLFSQIEKIITDKVYWVSIWDDPDWWARSKNLTNVKFSGATPFWNVYEWDIK